MGEANVQIETLYDGKFIRLVRSGGWEYVTRKNVTGIVGIVAVTRDEQLLLVEQHRPPVRRRVIELPAGLAGDVDEREDLAEAARRELLEETGYLAHRMEYLAEGTASAGITDELITLFRATELERKTDGGGEGDESIVVHAIALDEVATWLAERVREGVAVDLKVYAALAFARTGG